MFPERNCEADGIASTRISSDAFETTGSLATEATARTRSPLT